MSLEQVLAGYNASVFAYGQTASGKTHTIFGDRQASQGILAHAVNHVFGAAAREAARGGGGGVGGLGGGGGFGGGFGGGGFAKVAADSSLSVRVSVVEIYNEQISDLLWEPPPGAKRGGAF